MAAELSDHRIERLKDELTRKPDSFLFLPLAYHYLHGGRIEDAEKTCLHGLERHPRFNSARILLGLISFTKNDYGAALEKLKEAVEKDPANLLAHKLLGDVYIRTGDKQQGKDEYRKALAIRPRDEEAARRLKNVEAGATPDADGGEPPGLNARQSLTMELAEIYSQEGDRQEAMALYHELLEEAPYDERLREKINELESSPGHGPAGRHGTEKSAPVMLFVEPTPFWEHTGQIAQEYEGARAGNDDLSERLVGRVVEGLDGWLVEISAANKDTGEENGQEQNSDY